MVKFIAIENSYSENSSYRYDNVDVETYINYLNCITPTYVRFEGNGVTRELLTKNCTFFEVLQQANRLKFYFDIENVVNENTIYEIIDSFKEFMRLTYKVELTDYVLTLNPHSSHHAGFSYHLIFSHYCNLMFYMPNIVARFIDYAKNKGVDWTNCIDTSVYSKIRLFRSVNQVGITKIGGKAHDNDKHLIIKGDIRDSIIQDVSNCTYLNIREVQYRLKPFKLVNTNQSSNFKDLIAETVKQTIKQLIENNVIRESNEETEEYESSEITEEPNDDETFEEILDNILDKHDEVEEPNDEVECEVNERTTVDNETTNIKTGDKVKQLKEIKPLKTIQTLDFNSIPHLKPLPIQYINELSTDDKLFVRIFMLSINGYMNEQTSNFINTLIEYYKSHQSFMGFNISTKVISAIIDKIECKLA